MRLILTALVVAALQTVPLGGSANACWNNGVFYFALNGSDFKVGQYSQGGNYYYGVAGLVTTAYPPDPTVYPNAIPQQHVNQALATSDERFQGTSTPAALHSGWFVGFHEYNNTYRSSATVFAEAFRYSAIPVLFVGAPAQQSTWYKNQLIAPGPNATWHYDAFELVGGAWQQLGDGVDMTTSTTEQQLFGEASDPGSSSSSDRCRYLSNGGGGGANAYASLQLYVDAVQWQNWEPAYGRYACAFPERPYLPDPSTIMTDCAQGTFWLTKYTDFTVGGPP